MRGIWLRDIGLEGTHVLIAVGLVLVAVAVGLYLFSRIKTRSDREDQI